MNANELRIGNIIGRRYLNPNPKQNTFEIEPCFIKVIKEESVNITLSIRDKDVLSKIKYTSIEPIELTEEWLLKFGFEVENSFAYSTGEEVAYNVFSKSELTYNSIQDAWWMCGRIMKFQPKYVHQLQNLYFALTGEELKIN